MHCKAVASDFCPHQFKAVKVEKKSIFEVHFWSSIKVFPLFNPRKQVVIFSLLPFRAGRKVNSVHSHSLTFGKNRRAKLKTSDSALLLSAESDRPESRVRCFKLLN